MYLDLLHGTFENFNDRRSERLRRVSYNDVELMEYLAKRIDPSTQIGGEKVAILYASETGNKIRNFRRIMNFSVK